MSSHSVVAPSSAEIFMHCAGSVLMQSMYPESEESPEAREGTAAHEVMAPLVIHAARAGVGPDALKVGHMASNGVVVTQAMVDGAQMLANDVRAVMQKEATFTPHVEETIQGPRVHPTQAFGTPDVWLFVQKSLRLYLWDFKYGFDIVEVFENWQFIYYLAMLLDHLKINGMDEQHLVVIFRVVQPRAPHREGPIREWRIKAADLRAYVNQLSDGVHKALSSGALCVAGKWCRNCSACFNCDTATTAGHALMSFVGRPVPANLSPAGMGLELSMLRRAYEIIKARRDALEAETIARMRAGETVPRWATIQGWGRQAWAKPVGEILALGKLMQVDLRKPDDVITPKQAIDAGLAKEIVAAFSYTPKTGLKLIENPEDKARHIFGQHEG